MTFSQFSLKSASDVQLHNLAAEDFCVISRTIDSHAVLVYMFLLFQDSSVGGASGFGP